MRAGIRTNAREIAGRMRRRQDAVIRELSTEARRIGAVVSGEAKRILQADIYNVPIPLLASAERDFAERGAIKRARYRTGKRRGEKMRALSPAALDALQAKATKGQYGQWERSGNLKRQELWRTRGPVVILTNNAEYAIHRYRLGTPGRRKIRSPGVKSVQWQYKAALRKREAILRMRKAALWRAISGR